MSKPKRAQRSGKKRKQGGQKGHKRHLRELVPSEQCTTVTECRPDACRRCGGELDVASSAPIRHQVWELPPKQTPHIGVPERFAEHPVQPRLDGYDRSKHLWTFIRVEGIEPTNNTAERALRPAVIYRKLSFGTQSASGSRYLERILSGSETCRLQNRNAYEYLVQAMEAKFAGTPAPSLLPAEQASNNAAA